MYKMVNEELRIASCELKDLSVRETMSILAQFDGDTLETLNVFYNSTEDLIVLNSEHRNYQLILETCEMYLEADRETRNKIEDAVQEHTTSELIGVLDKAIARRDAKKIKTILENNVVTPYYSEFYTIKELEKIEKKSGHDRNMYMYGYIMGKRAERARRKKVNVVTI